MPAKAVDRGRVLPFRRKQDGHPPSGPCRDDFAAYAVHARANAECPACGAPWGAERYDEAPENEEPGLFFGWEPNPDGISTTLAAGLVIIEKPFCCAETGYCDGLHPTDELVCDYCGWAGELYDALEAWLMAWDDECRNVAQASCSHVRLRRDGSHLICLLCDRRVRVIEELEQDETPE